MRVFQFTEQPYPDAWDHEGSLRVTIPNSVMDPKIAAELYHRYYDEWQLADELGFDIMVNEHHSTATCMSAAAVVTLAILARITKRARLLTLGYPIANRPDPLRAAEELAMIDVISRGRLEMGFVRGVPSEIAVANLNPVFQTQRFWEAHDFIVKAMSSHGEPFNWESENFHYRQVNVWPRPYQQPMPPVWSTTGSSATAVKLGGLGYVMATLGTGYATRPLYDKYREGYRAAFGRNPSADRFAYLGLVAVAHNEKEAHRLGDLVASYLRSGGKLNPVFRNPPGYLSIADNIRILKGEGKPRSFTKAGRAVDMNKASVSDLVEAGVLFCGTPDQVYGQIADFAEHCGGMGNLLMMGHAGPMNHQDTVANLTLFGREVLPRLKTFRQPAATETA